MWLQERKRFQCHKRSFHEAHQPQGVKGVRRWRVLPNLASCMDYGIQDDATATWQTLTNTDNIWQHLTHLFHHGTSPSSPPRFFRAFSSSFKADSQNFRIQEQRRDWTKQLGFNTIAEYNETINSNKIKARDSTVRHFLLSFSLGFGLLLLQLALVKCKILETGQSLFSTLSLHPVHSAKRTPAEFQASHFSPFGLQHGQFTVELDCLTLIHTQKISKVSSPFWPVQVLFAQDSAGTSSSWTGQTLHKSISASQPSESKIILDSLSLRGVIIITTLQNLMNLCKNFLDFLVFLDLLQRARLASRLQDSGEQVSGNSCGLQRPTGPTSPTSPTKSTNCHLITLN